jgi:stage II sporulation SpoAA-like protein
VVGYELLRDDGIMILRPRGALEAADFENLAREVDPYIEANGRLNGILLDAESFPGWKDFAALVAHLRFVRGHHRQVQKIAVVSDSTFLAVAPKIAAHFVQADLRHFSHGQREAALAWLRGETESGKRPPASE